MPNTHQFAHTVAETIRKNELWDFRHKIVVAVSGGIDSVALLHILFTLAETPEKSLAVAHFNHRTRTSSDLDAEFVESLANKLHLPFFLGTLEKRMPQGMSPEHFWRRERYRFLLDVKRKFHAKAVATGHHADDQVETLLLKIITGCGPKGLTGIMVKTKEGIIRPLLNCRRKQLSEYVEHENFEYRQDPSNLDHSFPRNFIRHKVIPLLLELNPNVYQNIQSLQDLIREEDNYITHQVSACFQDLNVPKNLPFSLPDKYFLFLPLPILRRFSVALIRRIDSEQSVRLSRTLVENMVHLLQGHLKHVVIHPICSARRLKHEIHFSPMQFPEYPEKPAKLPIPGEILFGPWIIRSRLSMFPPSENPSVVVSLPNSSEKLFIRTRKPGDCFTLPDHQKRRKLKDLMNRLSIPVEQRDRIPLVVDESDRIRAVLTHHIQRYYSKRLKMENQIFIALFSHIV